jgi:long-chain acyl-CoA synthetase
MPVVPHPRTPVADSFNLALLAENSQALLGDHDAVIFEGQTLRSGALHERARRAAGGLADLGVEPGDRVVVLMANCPEVLISYNAIWRAGAVVTPVVFLVTGAAAGAPGRRRTSPGPCARSSRCRSPTRTA